MEGIFKILKFKSDKKKTLGKYAHISNMGGTYELTGSELPMIMKAGTKLEYLVQITPEIDYDEVDLVTVKIEIHEE